jgi:hypothetical protein
VFSLELFRVDKAEDPFAVYDSALSPPTGEAFMPNHMQRTGGIFARVAVANIGLHFSDSYANETAMYQKQLEYLALGLRKFNEEPSMKCMLMIDGR